MSRWLHGNAPVNTIDDVASYLAAFFGRAQAKFDTGRAAFPYCATTLVALRARPGFAS